MINNHGIIIDKTDPKEEDMTMTSIRKVILQLREILIVLYLGYHGIEKDFPEQLSSLPKRKKRNQRALSQEEKDYNKDHSKKRIVIEHTICRLKKYRTMSIVFRNKLRKYNKASDIVSCLVDYIIINYELS